MSAAASEAVVEVSNRKANNGDGVYTCAHVHMCELNNLLIFKRSVPMLNLS